MNNTARPRICRFTVSCNFFGDTMASVPHLSESMRGKYCKDGFEQCARYLYAKRHGYENIPADLFPNACPVD